MVNGQTAQGTLEECLGELDDNYRSDDLFACFNLGKSTYSLPDLY
jgi:hypothetical protein